MGINGTQIAQKFDQEWGAFRKFIAAHPLTGFWIGSGAGAVVVASLWKLFG